MTTNTTTQYANIRELASTFKVSPRTLASWKKQGCPCLNINPTGQRATLRFNLGEVEEWLREAALKGKEEA